MSRTQNRQPLHLRMQGFTLIEMMVVVVIIAILAAIALPSYQESLRRGRRAEGKAMILQIAKMEERYYTANTAYTDVFANLGVNNYSGSTAGTSTYNAVINVGVTPPTYAIAANLNPGFTDPTCGNLTYNNVGQKGASNVTTPAIIATCWQR